MAAVDPGGVEAEVLGAGDVPAVGGHEEYFLTFHVELLEGMGVGGGSGLELLDVIDAQDRVEMVSETGVFDQPVEHVLRAVRQDHELLVLQLLEDALDFGIVGEVRVGVDQFVFCFRRPFGSIFHEGIAEGLAGDRDEVFVRAHHLSQEEIIELFFPPRLTDGFAFVGEVFVARILHGMDVEECAIDVEYECFDGWLGHGDRLLWCNTSIFPCLVGGKQDGKLKRM